MEGGKQAVIGDDRERREVLKSLMTTSGLVSPSAASLELVRTVK
jgi:hypothetical protein